ncbi:MAG: glycosyltransferase family 4 protein [Candidatus Sumerlaeia bacterium]|nr:glycosyltransferase family 4 protein [Candidatus Sumerlaeia bacterium]
MNICLISRSLPLHRSGGLEYHTLDLAYGLAEKGHKVTLVTTQVPQTPPADEYSAIQLVQMPGTLPGKYNLTFFYKIGQFLSELNQSHKFDIIHAQGFSALTIKPRKLVPPLIVTIHGTLFSETALAETIWKRLGLAEKIKVLWQHKLRLLILPIYRQMLRRARVIVVDSQFTRQELCREMPALVSKIFVVPLGVNPRRYPALDRAQARQKLSLPKNTTIYFSVGRLHKLKGFQQSLLALHRLFSRQITRAEILYIIGGEGEYEAELRQLTTRLNLQHRVKFAGRITDELLPYYYASADAFIYPELSQPAFGLVAIESLLCGTPVIAARSGAIPEVVTPDVGITYPPFDTTALAEIFRQALEHPEWLRELQVRCREYALKNFSYSAMISKTEQIYNTVCSAET